MRTLLAIFGLLVTFSTLAAEAKVVISPLQGLMVGPHSFDPTLKLLKPFTSDGCSDVPNGTPGNHNLWLDCCVQHDFHYYIGGTAAEKFAADKEIRQCISDKGYPTIGMIFYEGVRAGGGPLREKQYRWGYGWNQLRPYGPVTAEEQEQMEAMYGKDLERLKDQIAKKQIEIVVPHDDKDYSIQRFSGEEIQIYQHLKSTLHEDDVVSEARLAYSGHGIKFYDVTLKSCKSKIRYVFDDVSFDVKDPKNCLKQ